MHRCRTGAWQAGCERRRDFLKLMRADAFRNFRNKYRRSGVRDVSFADANHRWPENREIGYKIMAEAVIAPFLYDPMDQIIESNDLMT